MLITENIQVKNYHNFVWVVILGITTCAIFLYLGFRKRKEIHFPLRCGLHWTFSQSLAALGAYVCAREKTKTNEADAEIISPLHLKR